MPNYENDAHEKEIGKLLNEIKENDEKDSEFSKNAEIDIDNMNINENEKNKVEDDPITEDDFNPENITKLSDVKEDNLPDVDENDEFYKIINAEDNDDDDDDDDDDLLSEIKHPALTRGSHVIEPPGNISRAFDMGEKGPVNVMGKGNRRLPKNLRKATKRLRVMRKTQRQIKEEDADIEALLDRYDLENDIRDYESVERDEDALLENLLVDEEEREIEKILQGYDDDNDDDDYIYESDDNDYNGYEDDQLDYLNERIENFLNAYDQRKEFMEDYEDNEYDLYDYENDEVSEKQVLREKDISELLEATKLPSEFKQRAAKLFEAAVQRKTNKNVQKVLEDVVNTVDGYMDQLASRWIEDYSSGEYTEVESDDEDTNKLQEEIKLLQGQLTEQYAQNVDLNNKITDKTREQIIQEYKDGMTLSDFEKFKGLTEDVKFVDGNKFRRKLDHIRETYFKNGTNTEIQGSSKFVITEEDIKEENEINENMSSDVQGFYNTLKRIPKLEDSA